jgi:hypothetical protein
MKRRCPRCFVVIAVLLLAGTALLAAACDGSEESTSTSTGGATTTVGGASTITTAGVSGAVVLKGLVDNPLTLTAADLEKMTVVTITTGDSATGKKEYRGVRFSDLFKTLKVQSGAATITMTASDGYTIEMSLTDILWSPDALLAIGDGGKLNVVIPDFEEKSWTKDVVSLEFK